MPSSGPTRRRFAADAVLAVALAAAFGVAAIAAGTSWQRSGHVHRNAFALARALDRLGLVSGAPRRVLLVAVYLVPLLVALAVLALVERHRRAAGAAVAAAGGIALIAAIVVLHVAGFRQPGPKLCLAVAPVSVLGGLWTATRRSLVQ